MSDPPSGRRAPWLEFHHSESHRHGRAIPSIFERELDGVTVTEVFTEAECRSAVEHFERCRSSPVEAMFGTMLGIPLLDLATRVDDPTDRSLYLADAARNRVVLQEGFGFDPADRVATALARISGLEVVTPTEAGDSYASGNLRWFEADRGGLPAHVDNEFNAYHDGTFDHLQSLAETDGHLSWFVVLQQPTAGGALSVFDQLYRTYVPTQDGWNDQGRDDAEFDELDARQIFPTPGSLVVFGGGWRWHRVDPVLPGDARVTYGGFAAAGHDARTLYVWF